MSNLIAVHNMRKVYDRSGAPLEVLRGVDLEIQKGEALCIMGSSGAGKSTLLQILGTLDRPTSGMYAFRGENILGKSDEELAKFRNQTMGFVFQFHHLLPEFNALENVMMPCQIAGMKLLDSRARAETLLRDMGLGARLTHYPSELSGGEQQRVAIARALVMQPEILFADEPTGNLDSQNSHSIQELFFELRNRYGLTLVVVSHDESFAKKFPRVLRMQDGHWIA